VAAGENSPAPAAAGPSFAGVLGTTLRLWLRRHVSRPAAWLRGPAARRGARLALALALVVVVVTAGGSLAVLLSRPAAAPHHKGAVTANQAVSPGGIGSSGAARSAAAAWVGKQVSHAAVVACDPAMCFALQAGGFAPPNLLALTSATAYPLGSTVIVATAAVRNLLGRRLVSVYAPVVIASFGSGAARVDVRAYAADSAASYRAALAADFAARRVAGQQLLRNPHLAVSPVARRDLAAGHVDSRLLITLAALAAGHDLRIVAFADADPGGDPLLPARSAELAVPGRAGARGAYLQSVLAFLQARHAPLLTARTRVTGAGAAGVLQISFPAPTPLGLLGRRAPA
jgi:hypothetical protein